MKIIVHGKKIENAQNEKGFKCKNCGCEFYCCEDEYYKTDNLKDGYVYLNMNYIPPNKKCICSCPECHKIVIDEIIDAINTTNKKDIDITNMEKEQEK